MTPRAAPRVGDHPGDEAVDPRRSEPQGQDYPARAPAKSSLRRAGRALDALRDEEKVIPRLIEGVRCKPSLAAHGGSGVLAAVDAGPPPQFQAQIHEKRGPPRPRSALVGSESGVPPPHRGPAIRFFATHEECRRRRLCSSPSGGVDCLTLRGLTATLHTAAGIVTARRAGRWTSSAAGLQVGSGGRKLARGDVCRIAVASLGSSWARSSRSSSWRAWMRFAPRRIGKRSAL